MSSFLHALRLAVIMLTQCAGRRLRFGQYQASSAALELTESVGNTHVCTHETEGGREGGKEGGRQGGREGQREGQRQG